MSGYLSRIVQTAARTNQSLRPLAGSVFGTPAEHAQPSHSNDAPFILETEEPASPPDASTTQRGKAGIPSSLEPESFLEKYQPLQPRQQPFPQLRHDSRDSSYLQPQDLPQATESNQAHTQPRSAENLPATAPGADSNAQQAADKHAFTPRITHRSDTVRKQSASRPAQSDSDTDNSKQQPQTAESKLSTQPTSRNQTQTVTSNSASMVRPQQPPTRDQRAAPPPEPGIEIHIGRIEVLAVQPPAPPVPAPRRDRTTSLADYLAGQNGRRS